MDLFEWAKQREWDEEELVDLRRKVRSLTEELEACRAELTELRAGASPGRPQAMPRRKGVVGRRRTEDLDPELGRRVLTLYHELKTYAGVAFALTQAGNKKWSAQAVKNIVRRNSPPGER